MASKAERGTKRICQNPDCQTKFYDLNHDPIVCPKCQTVFVPAVAVPTAAVAVEEPVLRKERVPAQEPVEAPEGELPAVEGSEVLPDIEVAEEPAAAGAGDDTFLEEEEEGGDVSNIIGGSVEGEEEET